MNAGEAEFDRQVLANGSGAKDADRRHAIEPASKSYPHARFGLSDSSTRFNVQWPYFAAIASCLLTCHDSRRLVMWSKVLADVSDSWRVPAESN